MEKGGTDSLNGLRDTLFTPSAQSVFEMKVLESSKNGTYEAVFSGEIVGEMVMLYRIRIGGEQIGSRLGYFEIDGVKKPISIESFTLAERESWSEDDYATAYRMMDTVNDVIAQITASKNYSEFSET